MDHNDIVKNAEMHVRELYRTHFQPEFVYHNLEHAGRVVKAALQIADHYQLKKEDLSAVHIASWFHDTGYLFDCNEHEEKSAKLAISFLKNEYAGQGIINKVKECILATKIFKKSSTLIAQIVSDADLYHLGTSEFWEKNILMRQEMELRSKKEIPERIWNEGALRLLKRHQFETDYCQKILQKEKKRNINKLWQWLDQNSRKIERF